MRRVQYLPDLARSADRRLVRLALLVQNIRPPCSESEARRIAFVTIEAANLWASFSRHLYLSSALGAYEADARGCRRQRLSTPRTMP